MNDSLSPTTPLLSEWKSRSFKRRQAFPSQTDLIWEIRWGLVRTLTWTDEGEVITLGLWGAGDVVGYSLSLIQPFQIEALVPVEAMTLSHGNCSSAQLIDHLHQTSLLLKITRYRLVETRLLEFLNWMGKRFGHSIQQGYSFELSLSHQVIAEVIGTSRVTVTRLLKRLEFERKIKRSKYHYIVFMD